MKTNRVGLISAAIYTGVSLMVSGIFLVVTLLGDYNWLTRIGGTTWVFLLSMIILMPTVISRVKKTYGA